MIEAVERVKNGLVGGTNQLTLVGIVIDWHSFMCAGRLTGDKIAVTQVDEQAAMAIGGIGEVLRTVLWLVGITDDLACMGRRRWSWCRRLRWLRSR